MKKIIALVGSLFVLVMMSACPPTPERNEDSDGNAEVETSSTKSIVDNGAPCATVDSNRTAEIEKLIKKDKKLEDLLGRELLKVKVCNPTAGSTTRRLYIWGTVKGNKGATSQGKGLLEVLLEKLSPALKNVDSDKKVDEVWFQRPSGFTLVPNTCDGTDFCWNTCPANMEYCDGECKTSCSY